MNLANYNRIDYSRNNSEAHHQGNSYLMIYCSSDWGLLKVLHI